MQRRSFRGSGEPVWVIASSNAGFRLGPDPRRALGPAAIRAASTGRTRDRTRPMLHKRQKALAKAPSTRDPKRTWHLGHAHKIGFFRISAVRFHIVLTQNFHRADTAGDYGGLVVPSPPW